MTSQHTPAPWATDEYGNEITAGSIIVARAHSTISVSAKERKKFDVIGFDDVETLKSNARLIAAAPELLEALELWKQYEADRQTETRTKAFAAMNSVLSKVKG